MDIIDLAAITYNMRTLVLGKSISGVEYLRNYGFYKLKTGPQNLWISVNPQYPFIDVAPDDTKGENSSMGMHIRGMVVQDVQIYQEDLVVIITLRHPLIPSKQRFLFVELQRMKPNIIVTSTEWIINWIHREVSGRSRELFVGGIYIPPPTGSTIPISQWDGNPKVLVRGLSKERKNNQNYEEIKEILKCAQLGKGETGTIGKYWHILTPSESPVRMGSWLDYYRSLISTEAEERRKAEQSKRREEERRKLGKLLQKLEKELESTNKAEMFMKLGNALLTYPQNLGPDGTFSFEDWETGEIITYKFKPGEPAQKLARMCFDKYKRLKAKRERLTLRIREIEARLQEEAFEAKTEPIRQKTSTIGKVQPAKGILKFSDGKNLYIVGKNAKASHTVTFKIASEQDLWFHTRAYEGSHVILKGLQTKHTIETAAKLAAYFSKAPKTGPIEVAYTPKRYVKPIKGVTAGVTYRNERIVRVKPASPEELGLKPV